MYLSKMALTQPDSTIYNKYGLLGMQVVNMYAGWLTEAGIPYTLTVEIENESSFQVYFVLYDRIRIVMYNSSNSFYMDLYNHLVAGSSSLMQSYAQPFYSSLEYNFEVGLLVTDASVSFLLGNYKRHSSGDFALRNRNCSTMTIFPFILNYTDEDFVTFGFANCSGNTHNLYITNQFSMSWLQDPYSAKSTSWSYNSLYGANYDGIAIADMVHSNGVHYIPGLIRIGGEAYLMGKFSDGENMYLGWWNVAARLS